MNTDLGNLEEILQVTYLHLVKFGKLLQDSHDVLCHLSVPLARVLEDESNCLQQTSLLDNFPSKALWTFVDDVCDGHEDKIECLNVLSLRVQLSY